MVTKGGPNQWLTSDPVTKKRWWIGKLWDWITKPSGRISRVRDTMLSMANKAQTESSTIITPDLAKLKIEDLKGRLSKLQNVYVNLKGFNDQIICRHNKTWTSKIFFWSRVDEMSKRSPQILTNLQNQIARLSQEISKKIPSRETLNVMSKEDIASNLLLVKDLIGAAAYLSPALGKELSRDLKAKQVELENEQKFKEIEAKGSLVSVEMGSVKKNIPLMTLLSMSDKFKDLLISETKNNYEPKISLPIPKNVSENTLNIFVDLLAGDFPTKDPVKNTDLMKDIIIDLFRLADAYQVKALNILCSAFLEKNLNHNGLKQLLAQDAYNLPQLKWVSITYISKFPKDFTNLENDMKFSSEARSLVSLGLRCSANGIDIAMLHSKWLSIDNVSQSLDLIKELQNKVGIDGLEIKDNNLDQNGLNNLARICLKLDLLSIENNDKITFIPEEWCKKLTWGGFVSCHSLKSLHLPNATNVQFRDCSSVTDFSAPKVVDLHLSKSIITSLDIPMCEQLICTDCNHIGRLDLKIGKDVTVISCDLMVDFNAPIAEKVYVNGCKSIITLNAQEAEVVNSSSCTQLVTINAPKAKLINRGNCPKLVTIIALPNAEMYP